MSHSSKHWLQRHISDPFVKRAREEGYRSRAAYKLLEIDSRDRLLRTGATVIDLGAAPGGWSQVASAKVGAKGRVIAIDLLEMPAPPGVQFIQGSFLDPAVRAAALQAAGGKVDLVLSDMMPNVSGIASADQARAAELVHEAIEFCGVVLKPGGGFLVKVFQGEEFAGILAELRRCYASVQTRKPAASRGESRETYLFARKPKVADSP